MGDFNIDTITTGPSSDQVVSNKIFGHNDSWSPEHCGTETFQPTASGPTQDSPAIKCFTTLKMFSICDRGMLYDDLADELKRGVADPLNLRVAVVEKVK